MLSIYATVLPDLSLTCAPQLPRGNVNRQGTEARLRCLAAQAAASAMSKASKVTNTIGIPEVRKVQPVLHIRGTYLLFYCCNRYIEYYEICTCS